VSSFKDDSSFAVLSVLGRNAQNKATNLLDAQESCGTSDKTNVLICDDEMLGSAVVLNLDPTALRYT
jgi:hypothetical protein